MIAQSYTRLRGIASHKRASYALATIALLDGSLSPLPPDVLLVPMILAQPQRARAYAILTIVCSAVGAAIGYGIGHFAFDFLGAPMIQYLGYMDAYSELTDWFGRYGVFVLIMASVVPIPFKLWCIAAGALHMFVPAFLIAVIIARITRFSIVAWIVAHNQRGIAALFHWARAHSRLLLILALICLIPAWYFWLSPA